MRNRLSGLAALLLMLGIIAGLPAVLLITEPATAPTVDWSTVLTSPDDGTLALAALRFVAWAAWGFLSLTILVELVSKLRGVRAPRLPGLRLPQSAARGLVSTAAMLFVVGPVGVTAATAAPMPHSAPAAVTISVDQDAAPAPVPSAHAAAPTAAPQPKHEAPAPSTTAYTVGPGESLWSIARDQLGSGHRYVDIVALNHDVLGDDPGFVRPGWVLQLPVDAPAPAATTPAIVTVERGDTLAELAETHLGDPQRYPEIFEASRGIVQPGGAQLTDPDVIDVGWTLAIPAATPAAVETPAPAETAPPAGTAPPVPVDGEAAQPAPAVTEAPAVAARQPSRAGAAETTPDSSSADAAPAQSDVAPDPAAPVAEKGDVDRPETVHDDAPTTDLDDVADEDPWLVRTTYGAGAILAAGVLGLLAARRRTQQRRRLPGQRLPMPDGAVARAERDLRVAGDPLSIETVDVALRTLAARCAAAGTPLPVVRAARLTATQFDLYLAEPTALPSPWTGTADASVWTLQVENTQELEGLDTSGLPAPYPSLVVIGHDPEGGHVLLDLEYLGALNIGGGDGERTQAILAALAVELSTSVWADHLRVTVVGAFPELEDAMRTGRVRYLPSVGKLLDELRQRAEQDRDAMTAAGTPNLQHARVSGAVPDAWIPEIVLLAGEMTPLQHNQLEDLLEHLPRVALAAVTAGVDVTEWGLDLDGGQDRDHAVLWPIGLQLRPQCLPAEQYAQILQLITLADPEELQPADEHQSSLASVSLHPAADIPTSAVEEDAPAVAPATAQDIAEDAQLFNETTTAAAAADGPPAAPTSDESTPAREPVAPGTTAGQEEAPVEALHAAAPRILVIGPVAMEGAGGPVESSKRHRLLEYATYLALHPGAEYPAIDEAIWPSRTREDNTNTRNTYTGKLRSWLGKDAEGKDYLPRYTYTLSPAVRTDVDDWDDLLGGDPLHASTEHLEHALRLVRGRPFEGHRVKYYAWAEPIIQRLASEIVDASYELARRRLMEGRWRAAEEALIVGLRIEPAQERLWRMRILAAHETHNADAEAEAIERLLTITEELEFELEPETEAMLEALKRPGADFDQLIAAAL